MSPLLFAAGDVGGARALLPVIALASAYGQRPWVLKHGALTTEKNVAGDWIGVTDLLFADPAHHPGAYLFAGSVADQTPLRLARQARASGIPTIFVLDSWTSYAARLAMDGLEPFVPDAYCVPDRKAEADAKRDGVTATIAVTGQPAFADVLLESRGDAPRARPGIKVLFVSEPAEADHGRSRGYTETDVMTGIAEALQGWEGRLMIDVLPHPRDDAAKVAALWNNVRGDIPGEILEKNTLRSVVDYDGVAGMASVLLYRAWLLGLPVLSCQPGLLLDPLRQFGEREAIVLVDKIDTSRAQIQAWAKGLVAGRTPVLRPDAHQHAGAAEAILRIAHKLGYDTPTHP